MIRRLPAALAGLLTLAAGLVGLPAFLIGAAHQLAGLLPAVGDLPAALLAPGDGGLFLATMLGIGWLCWLVFVIAFLVEITARTRGVRTPHLGRFIPQQTAAWAVTAVVALLATVSPSPGVADASAQTVTVAAAAPASATPHPAKHPASGPRHTGEESHDTRESYLVKRGDTLWDIAEDKLDDGTAWPAIAKASRDIDQPDGRHLTDPDLILPGWTLHIPSSGQGDESSSSTHHGRETTEPGGNTAGRAAAPTEPALPGTPLRASSSDGSFRSQDAWPSSALSAKLPSTPLRPSVTPSQDGALVAAGSSTELSAMLPSTPLHQPAEAPTERRELIAAAATVPGLPGWVRHPLTPTSLEQAPQATRSQILTALATQRGLLPRSR